MRHIPVLLRETIEALEVRPGGRYVDGTLGRAGHAREIIARGGKVLGIDRDGEALREIGKIEGLLAVHGNHGSLAELARKNGWNEVDGILLDLGVSSPQLDEAARGFSFLHEGPLDMRMDQSGGIRAAEIVNEADETRLVEVFRRWGEEPQARRLAKAIVKARLAGMEFRTTKDLADLVEATIGRQGGRHPATRVFQALRMEVNDEMGELERALQGGLEILKRGGRFAVITFESLTDRVVKRFFADHVGKLVSLQQGGEEWVGVEPRAMSVYKKSIVAGSDEVQVNPRSRSARLRVIMKV